MKLLFFIESVIGFISFSDSAHCSKGRSSPDGFFWVVGDLFWLDGGLI